MIRKKFFLPTDIKFGKGALGQLRDIVRKDDRVFFVTDNGLESAGLANRVRGILREMGADCATFNDVEPNPTSELTARVLKLLMEYNLMARPQRFANIAKFLGCNTEGLDVYEQAELSADAVHRLFEKTGAKIDLKKFGVKASHAGLIAEETGKMFLLKNNPRVPSPKDCEDVFLRVCTDYGIK